MKNREEFEKNREEPRRRLAGLKNGRGEAFSRGEGGGKVEGAAGVPFLYIGGRGERR